MEEVGLESRPLEKRRKGIQKGGKGTRKENHSTRDNLAISIGKY